MKIPKLATIPVPAPIWCGMAPQQQMLFVTQRLVEFMASPYFTTFEGFRIRITHPEDTTVFEDVLVIGAEEASKKSVIIPSRGLIMPGNDSKN